MKNKVISKDNKGFVPILAEYQKLLAEDRVQEGEKRIQLSCIARSSAMK